MWSTSTLHAPHASPPPLWLVERPQEHVLGGLLGEVAAREHGHHQLPHDPVVVPRLVALDLEHLEDQRVLVLAMGDAHDVATAPLGVGAAACMHQAQRLPLGDMRVLAHWHRGGLLEHDLVLVLLALALALAMCALVLGRRLVDAQFALLGRWRGSRLSRLLPACRFGLFSGRDWP